MYSQTVLDALFWLCFTANCKVIFLMRLHYRQTVLLYNLMRNLQKDKRETSSPVVCHESPHMVVLWRICCVFVSTCNLRSINAF